MVQGWGRRPITVWGWGTLSECEGPHSGFCELGKGFSNNSRSAPSLWPPAFPEPGSRHLLPSPRSQTTQNLLALACSEGGNQSITPLWHQPQEGDAPPFCLYSESIYQGIDVLGWRDVNKTDGLRWLQGGWGLLEATAGKCHWILPLCQGKGWILAG